MDAFADTLWQEFAVETEEHLQAAEPLLVQPDPPALAADDIAQLFRAFHSIKGLARAMGVLGMESVAHHAENLLSLVRDGQAPLTAEWAELLLQAIDALKLMRDTVAAQRHDVAADPNLIARLGAAFAARGGAADDAPPSAGLVAVNASDKPLHEDPEMLGIFVELVRTLGPELCAALADAPEQRQAAIDAAEALSHAAEVMNLDAVSTALSGLRALLQPLQFASSLDEPARQDILTRLLDLRLQIEVLGELTNQDAGTAAFSAALAPRLGDERQRLVAALAALNRQWWRNETDGDRLAAEADAAAVARMARALRAVLAALSQRRAAEIVLLIEDLYGRIANGEVEPAEAILATVDRIVRRLAAGDSGRATDEPPEAEAAELGDSLRQLTASAAQKALQSGERLISGLHIPPELVAILSDENLGELRRGIEQDGLIPYEIVVHLEEDADAARRWTQWLRGEARAITNRTVLSGGESWFEALVLSRLEPEALSRALHVIDPRRRCIKRVRRLTSIAGGEPILDQLAPGAPSGGLGIGDRRLAPQNLIRVRGDLVESLLDEIGEFRVAAATLRHLIRGIGGREIMARSRALASRLPPGLRNEFLALVRDARERDRRLLETEETITGMLSRLHQAALELRVVPVDVIFNRLPRIVRDLAQRQDKSVELILEGREVRIDKSMVDALVDPLIHMVRNAVDHGIEPPGERRRAGKPEQAMLMLRAAQHGSEIRIEIRDDGRGLDIDAIRDRAVARGLRSSADAARLTEEELVRLIFEPGLSTAATVTETSGRGVGMDVVQTTVRRLDGDIGIHSEPGRGTTFSLRLPVSAALQTALIVRVGDQSLAIPERHILAVAEIETDAIRRIGEHRSILHRQAVLPLYGLGDLLGMDAASPMEQRPPLEPVVVASNGRQMIGLEVDAIEHRQELFLKDIDSRLASFPGIGGASVLGDGRVVLVLDGEELIQLAARGVEPASPAGAELVS